MVRYFVVLSILVLMINCRQQPNVADVLTPTAIAQVSSNQPDTHLAIATQVDIVTLVPATATLPFLPTPKPTETPKPTVLNTPTPELACPVLTNDMGFVPSGHILFIESRSSRYDYTNDLYVVDTDGTNLTRLTPLEEFTVSHVAVSPDGSRIAYMSTYDGNPEIYVVNIDGSGFRRVTNNTIRDEYPTWHPDNTKLAYSSAAFPIWSPDSQYLIISVEEVDDRTQFWQNYLIDVENNTMAQLPHFDYSSSIFYMILGWLPDSEYIVIASNRDTQDAKLDIYLASIDGTKWRRLTTDDVDSSFSDFMWNALSPDSTHIAFTARQSGPGLRIMKIDGTNCYTIHVDASRPLFPLIWVP